jgi:hypothetical protein
MRLQIGMIFTFFQLILKLGHPRADDSRRQDCFLFELDCPCRPCHPQRLFMKVLPSSRCVLQPNQLFVHQKTPENSYLRHSIALHEASRRNGRNCVARHEQAPPQLWADHHDSPGTCCLFGRRVRPYSLREKPIARPKEPVE